jgi:hypothetical protein
MRTLKILAVLVAAALAPAALAQKAEVSGAVATAPGQAKAVALVTANGTIEAIDAKTRTLQIKLGSGEMRSVQVGDEVRNFDQLKVGDKVKAKYIESLTLELKKGDTAVVGRSESASLDRSKPGAKPGGTAVRELTVVADVVNVDAQKKVVSVKNDKGEMIDLDIQDPKQLALIQKGDKIKATYTVAVAVAVEPASAPAAAPAAPAKKK